MKARFFTLVMTLALLLAALVPVGAQDFTEQQVIDMVIAQPPFSYGLQTVSDWTAAAYDTGNAYGIWHVQFWDSEGEELAWANIMPSRQRLYDHDAYFGSTEAQRVAAEPLVRDFIVSHPDVIELLGDPDAYRDQTYIEYNGWLNAWGAWIDRGDDTLYVIVQFKGMTPDALTEPTLLEIGFPNVMSYDDWQTSMKDDATTIAFTQPQVAAALRDVSDWTAEAERQDDGLWQVTFKQAETALMTALVNLETRETVEWNTSGD